MSSPSFIEFGQPRFPRSDTLSQSGPLKNPIDSPRKWDGLPVRHTPLALAFPESQRVSAGKICHRKRTGRKADPAQVEKDIETARNPSSERQFSCTEWLTKLRYRASSPVFLHGDAKNRAYLVCQWKRNKI